MGAALVSAGAIAGAIAVFGTIVSLVIALALIALGVREAQRPHAAPR